MTPEDIEHYEFQRREQMHQRDHMHEAVMTYDRYLHPMQIIDTDYDNFMYVYTCREEERIPQEHDDTDTFLDDWRIDNEEGIPLPPKRLAKDTILKNLNNQRYLDL